MDGSDLVGGKDLLLFLSRWEEEILGQGRVSCRSHWCCHQPLSTEGPVASFAFVSSITGPLKRTHNQAHPCASNY